MKFIVVLDGQETTLTFIRKSKDRGYEYMTEGNARSIGFPIELKEGSHFTSSGHRVYVRRVIP